MNTQQLISELAIAEKNVLTMYKLFDLNFSNEVSKAFTDNRVTTYSDLVMRDIAVALRLRKLAIKEKLLLI